MLEAADPSNLKASQPPPGLLLALGSAYFRSGRLADAEREYRATLEVQPKQAEARINLAVVLLMTGRPADAKEQLKQAKKNGYKVPPGLEADIDAAIAKAKG
jgi:Flp pilus assembly protein TadD